jgi:hypothetical protein
MIYLESYTQDAVTQSSEPEAHVKSARHTILLKIYMYIINIKLLKRIDISNCCVSFDGFVKKNSMLSDVG